MINIGDIYVYYTGIDFSVWRVSAIRSNSKNNFNKVYMRKVYLIDEVDDDFNKMNFDVYNEDDIHNLEKANECRNKHEVIKKLMN